MASLLVRSQKLLVVATALAIAAPMSTTAGAASEQSPQSTDRFLIAGTDQASGRLLLMDPHQEEWSETGDRRAVKWSWEPSVEDGFDASTPEWRNVDDVKLRYSELLDTRVMVSTASFGFVGLIRYPSGERLWSVNADDGVAPLDNPHSAEYLPNGNVAAVASAGDWLRVYTASQGPDSEDYVEYVLPGGHGVLWDPERALLWALGDDHLVGLEVGGTPAEPTLREVVKAELPNDHGHDLQPVYGNTDRLWVSTGSRVFQYIKSTNSFTADYPYSAQLDRRGVKAVSNHPITGQVVQTVPKADCATTWCTDTVDFFGPDTTRTREGAQFYKARWLVADYQ